MLGGLCITRKACRPMDDESPDDASGIVSNCSIKCDGVLSGGGVLQVGKDEDRLRTRYAADTTCTSHVPFGS